jgi:TetR/AcrR family transcriptional regulator, copper-responsive repressor
MYAFWRNGYEATSLAELSIAMNMNPPSIYGAFGDKQELFTQAVDAYQQGPGCFAQQALEEETNPRRAIERLLMEAAANFTSRQNPPGCMVVLSGLNCADAAVTTNLQKRRQQSANLIATRVQEAHNRGLLPKALSPEALVNIVLTLFQGMSFRARDGATRSELESVVKETLKLWPV